MDAHLQRSCSNEWTPSTCSKWREVVTVAWLEMVVSLQKIKPNICSSPHPHCGQEFHCSGSFPLCVSLPTTCQPPKGQTSPGRRKILTSHFTELQPFMEAAFSTPENWEHESRYKSFPRVHGDKEKGFLAIPPQKQSLVTMLLPKTAFLETLWGKAWKTGRCLLQEEAPCGRYSLYACNSCSASSSPAVISSYGGCNPTSFAMLQ